VREGKDEEEEATHKENVSTTRKTTAENGLVVHNGMNAVGIYLLMKR